jgi:tetratricopeptide (TPR) repeat protein
MSLDQQELENSASKYAAEAIRLDSQGSHDMAIQSYRHAIEAIAKLIQIYPEYKLNKVYMERANAYQNRIKTLQMTHGLDKETTISVDLNKEATITFIDPSPRKFRTNDSNDEMREKVLNEFSIARSLVNSYRSSSIQQFSPFQLENDDIFDVSYIVCSLNDVYHIETPEHWEAIVNLFDLLSEKDRITIIDIVSRNPTGIEVSKIEKIVDTIETFHNNLENLIDTGVIEETNSKLLPGSNMDKAIITLEILRNALHQPLTKHYIGDKF